MKKVLYSLILMMTFMFLPNSVSAMTANVTIKCSDITAGGTSTCTLTGKNSGDHVGSIGANFTISGGTFVSFSKGSGWAGDAEGSGTRGNFLFYTDTGKNGSWSIGTIKIKGSKEGKVTLTLSSIEVGNNDTGDMVSVGNKSASFNVKAKTTKSTTKPKITTTSSSSTTKPIISTSSNTYDPNFSSQASSQTTTSHAIIAKPSLDIQFSSVTVDNFEVKYEHGIYTVMVNPDTETVNVSATGPEGAVIAGTGTKTLSVGQNPVELSMRTATGEVLVAPLYILRPDPNKKVDTRLKDLKVVGYKLEFNPDKLEYTVSVPFGCKEIYIDYESMDTDAIVSGGGLISLANGTSTIYIKSTYGSISTTDYTIKIKKNYLTIVLIVIIVLLCGGIGGMLFYYFNEKKQESNDANNAKNKAVADVNRAELAKGPQVSFNGQNLVGTGRRTVTPTVVGSPAPQAPGTQPVNNTPGVQNPTGVASTQLSSVTPPTNSQVKVIKKIVTNNTPNSNNPNNNGS